MPRQRVPKTVSISFRITQEDEERLQAHALQMGVKFPALMRGIVSTALGDDAQIAALRDAYFIVRPLMHRCVGYATQAIYEALPQLLEEEMRGLAKNAASAENGGTAAYVRRKDGPPPEAFSVEPIDAEDGDEDDADEESGGSGEDD